MLTLACAPKATPPEAAPPTGPPPIVEAQLMEIVEEGFSQAEGWTLAPLVQLEREGTRAVVIWPMFDPAGVIVDDDVVGVTVDADGQVQATNWRPDPRRLAVELGGEDFVARSRAEGVAQDQLGEEAVALSEVFRAARDARDGPAAVAAAQAFSQLFSLEPVLDQTVTELLIRAGGWVYVTRRPQSRTAVIVIEIDGETVELNAATVGEDLDRWAFQ